MFCFFGHKAYGILALWSGIKPAPPALEGEVLTTGPPGKSLNRGQDGWMASLTQWAWVWANSSGRRWGTEKPGVLQSLESQRVRHDLVTEQQQHLQTEVELFKNTQKRESDFLAAAVHIHNLLLFTFTPVISTWYFADDWASCCSQDLGGDRVTFQFLYQSGFVSPGK